MKRKHADRIDWHRVLERKFICSVYDDVEFRGYITLISIEKIKEPIIITIQGQDISIADVGYYWMQHFPVDLNYCVTTMINEKFEVVQWYLDISKSIGVNEHGIPYWDDLYLDIVVLPGGDFYIKDEDELREALDNRQIQEEDYRLVKNITSELVKEIKNKENKIINNSMKHFNYILNESHSRH